jgi:hypothetical protein
MLNVERACIYPDTVPAVSAVYYMGGLMPHQICSYSSSPSCLHAALTIFPLHKRPFSMYTDTSAPSSSAIAFTPNVISAIIHPEDSSRTSIPETVDIFLPAMVSHCHVSIILSFSDPLLPCLGNSEAKVY